MSDQPDNLVLIQLRGPRQEFGALMEGHVASMKATHRVYERLEKFYDELALMRGELVNIRKDLSAEIVNVRDELGRTRGDLHNEIARTRGELHEEIMRTRDEIAGTRGDLKDEIVRTRGDVQDQIARSQDDIVAFKDEVGRSFVKIEGDLIHLEIQNIARHGETLHALQDIHDLQHRTDEIERHLSPQT